MKHQQKKNYVVCVKNEGYEVSLERRKIYRVLPDARASERDLIRVIDESGQAYLYPEECFAEIRLPQPILKAFAKAA